MPEPAASFTFDTHGASPVLLVHGEWTIWTVMQVDEALRAIEADLISKDVVLDVSQLQAMDTAGAFVIDRTLRGGDCAGPFAPLRLQGSHQTAARLLNAARGAHSQCPPHPPPPPGLVVLLTRIGEGVAHFFEETAQSFSFVGQMVMQLFFALAMPWRTRWTSVIHHMEETGLNALPIIAFLSFFIGMVLAYLGAIQLQVFGATIYVVELVGISVMREFGVILTAIVLAGRSASAFAAEIGAMRMQEEVDALKVTGLEPIHVLATPRLLAIMLMIPVLTLIANGAGILGGLVAAWARLGISPVLFLTRTEAIVPMSNLWIGLIKGPVFAFLIAIAGCRQGLSVGYDVASLGRKTTAAVVQAIFLVIFVDALFAIVFQEAGW